MGEQDAEIQKAQTDSWKKRGVEITGESSKQNEAENKQNERPYPYPYPYP
jgi:hypothetical protein